jgi:hypothetical protein
LLIKWQPQIGDLVSFFSLECSGAAGSSKGDHKYSEVFRDPPDANPNSPFSLSYKMSNLLPGTTYLFRIRGMNGYGPGDFCYKNFTTYPGLTLAPRTIRLSPTSVQLRWVFSSYFMKRLEDLKKIFSAVDKDGSGNVSREELADVIIRKSDKIPELSMFLTKALEKLGLSEEEVRDFCLLRTVMNYI